MRDIKLQVLQDYGLDVDIIDGEAEYLDYENQTSDQRAALSVYASKGTVPGALDYGISWSNEYTPQNTISQLNNEVQLQIQNEAGASEDDILSSSQYMGNIIASAGSVGVIITRGA